jgi:hypothetical protein
MSDDTHDQLVKTYLEYFEANEKFERRPSERTKRAARRHLRSLIHLAKQRQDEIQATYNTVLEGYRKDQKWQKDK